MAKRIKKKKHIKFIPVLIALVCLIIILFIAVIVINLPIKNIYVKGNYYLTDQEVIDSAKINNYPSFILTTKKQIKKELNKYSIINKVNVSKKIWGKIYITVDEYNVLFRQYNDDNKVVLENGKEIDDIENRYKVPKLLNYVPDTKYNDFIKSMSKIDENIKMQISELSYVPNEQDKDRFLLYMNDGNYVYLTITKFKQINYYEDVLKSLNGRKGILYLDSGNHFKIME